MAKTSKAEQYANVTTIQIAPYANEIEVNGNTMHTSFAGVITYTAEGLDQYEENSLKDCFSTAIALSSNRWQLERLLNETLKLNGKIS